MELAGSIFLSPALSFSINRPLRRTLVHYVIEHLEKSQGEPMV